ncbi:MAG TPA: hypothetical protein VGP93_18895 [Polyangiaceae bacterium]|nr:hypothetical protein [Polyangiaceae bacterium]
MVIKATLGHAFAGSLLAVMLLGARVTRAAEPAPTSEASVAAVPERPRLHHAPVAVTRAHEALIITAEIDHPERVRRALLLYTTDREHEPRQLQFARAARAPYVVTIPGAEIEPGFVSYWIELELDDGSREAVFGSQGEPHLVSVSEQPADARERSLLNRVQGRRSTFSLSGDYVDFGTSTATIVTAQGAEQRQVRDRYYRIEGSYTYRLLRTVVEFSLRAGVVRGTSPVPVRDQDASGRDPFGVGLNYGAPSARFRLSDEAYLEAEFLTSVTEDGFAIGSGGALLLGDLYGAHLALGVEHIGTFGSRFFTRLDVPVTGFVVLAPIIEVTNMPHANEYGVRLLSELTFDLGKGFSANLRGGYQARLATDGGPGVGATLAYSF